MMVKAPRIGVFGGAFDPPHATHVALARSALAQLDLIELRILPTGTAWHKARPLSAPQHRLAMTHLAFDELRQAVVDPREMLRSGPTYTLDTLRELQAERPGAQLVLIIGGDQAASMMQWQGWQEIVRMAILAVAWRPPALVNGGHGGVSGPPADAARAAAPRILSATPPGARVELLEIEPSEISATAIRVAVAHGEPLDRLVPPAVARYIDQHHLYQPT